MNQEVLYAVDGGVALLTLNRPERLNAITPAMRDALQSAFLQAGSDPAVRVAVLTGAGRGFCAGADIGRLQGVASAADSGQPAPAAPTADRYNFVSEFGKPLIACINGVAAGVGLVLALQCDLRWAASDATLMTAFARRGLIAEYGCAFRLERLVGPAVAADLLFSARKVSGSEAASIGLANRAEPADALLASVLAYARMLADEVSPRSLAVMKRQLYAAQRQSFAEALALAGEEMAESFKSADFREGVAHFLEKRAPRFTGL
ncbi:MAG: enoyl-CoA hydratase-related protein [Cupriavidus necator]